MRYAIVMKDEEFGPCYWVTRFGDTDNYTLEKEDATTFASNEAAYCLTKAIGLEGHEVVLW